MTRTLMSVLFFCTLLAGTGCNQVVNTGATMDKPNLAHNVFFQLKDGSNAAVETLTEECHTYLKDHPGVVYFSAGHLVAEHDREVNVRDFHVGLHVVFTDKAAHDLYQEAADHKTFIERNQANWAGVRVFDTTVR